MSEEARYHYMRGRRFERVLWEDGVRQLLESMGISAHNMVPDEPDNLDLIVADLEEEDRVPLSIQLEGGEDLERALLDTSEAVQTHARRVIREAVRGQLNLVGWPEWFLPLMRLRGFTYGDHRTAINDIAQAAQVKGITAELVVANFVAYWMPRRDQARWECPVAGLWEDLEDQVDQVVKAAPARRAAVLELASSSVGPEYGCRYCKEGGFSWAHDNRTVEGGGSPDRWPLVCDHTSRMAAMGRGGPPWAWQPRSWGTILKSLEARLPATVYTSWVMDLELLGFDAQVALVHCCNRAHATWIYRHLIETLRDTLEAELGDVQDVDFVNLELMMVWGGDDDDERTKAA
jgi:hypothetical protein